MECSITKSEHGGAGAGVGLPGLDSTLHRSRGAWLTLFHRWACRVAVTFLPSAHLTPSLWRICVHSLKAWVSMATSKMGESLTACYYSRDGVRDHVVLTGAKTNVWSALPLPLHTCEMRLAWNFGTDRLHRVQGRGGEATLWANLACMGRNSVCEC